MNSKETLFKSSFDNLGSIEDVQDNISDKLAKIFSFYNEQEFLDEMHGLTSSESKVSVE